MNSLPDGMRGEVRCYLLERSLGYKSVYWLVVVVVVVGGIFIIGIFTYLLRIRVC